MRSTLRASLSVLQPGVTKQARQYGVEHDGRPQEYADQLPAAREPEQVNRHQHIVGEQDSRCRSICRQGLRGM
jgi:hypothetical protein